MKLIQRLRRKHSIKMLCRIFGVSRSSYYQALQHKPSAREVTINAIKQRILEIYLQSKRRYGCIKIRHVLLQQGVLISQNKVLRLMREMQIRSIVSKKYRPNASKQSPADRKHLVNRQFSAQKPNQIWLSDITYIRTKNNGWTYLASILDVCTRKIVGYSYAKQMTVDLTLQALNNAYRNQNRPKNLILHSDQSAQYIARSYQKQAESLGITLSFSRKGCPYDNAPMEAFHSILKKKRSIKWHTKTFITLNYSFLTTSKIFTTEIASTLPSVFYPQSNSNDPLLFKNICPSTFLCLLS